MRPSDKQEQGLSIFVLLAARRCVQPANSVDRDVVSQFLASHLQAFVVGAVGLGLPQQRQQPPHGHLMVEDAFAGVEVAAVSHRGRVEVKDVEDCGVVRSLADRERSRLYLVCSPVHSLAATELAVTVGRGGRRAGE